MIFIRKKKGKAMENDVKTQSGSRELSFRLTSNGYELSHAPERLGWLAPTDPGIPVERLREQYRAQGYIWLKDVLPRRKVLEFRRRYFEAFFETGMISREADVVEGIYAGGGEDRVAVNRALMMLVRSAAYESFCLMEEIWHFYDIFLEGASYLHKRKLVRHTRPFDKNCTGAHYDLVYLRGGTDRLCTSWIPIGDIPVEMGGLVYLEGSDAIGRKMEAEYQKTSQHLSPEERVSAYNRHMDNSGWMGKDLAALADTLNTRWLVADYEAGDMVVHSPYMMHAATMNVDPNGRMRLSTDIRYQRVQDEIDARWQNHWSLDDML
jgi:ectoine hydroxylase-related dioxygenase (phytanoyl-CoA dioxygenase family)